MQELTSGGWWRLDREHVTHGHVLTSWTSDHHVEWSQARRRLMLVTNDGSQVTMTSSQHQLLLQLQLLMRVKLVRLHDRSS